MKDYDVLISGLNWVGDSVMAMPALQLFVARNPGVRIAIVGKPGIAPLNPIRYSVNEPPERSANGVARPRTSGRSRFVPHWSHTWRESRGVSECRVTCAGCW